MCFQRVNQFKEVQGASNEDEWIKTACRVPDEFGTETYLQWNATFIQHIASLKSDNIRRVLNPCRCHLEVDVECQYI